MHIAQFGRGYLTPNNPFSVPSIVKYGFSADNLQFTQTGAAEVSSACIEDLSIVPGQSWSIYLL